MMDRIFVWTNVRTYEEQFEISLMESGLQIGLQWPWKVVAGTLTMSRPYAHHVCVFLISINYYIIRSSRSRVDNTSWCWFNTKMLFDRSFISNQMSIISIDPRELIGFRIEWKKVKHFSKLLSHIHGFNTPQLFCS